MGPRVNWVVLTLSGLGVALILLGLLALALPPAYEGIRLWQLDGQHTLYLMDLVGLVAVAAGMGSTWLGGLVWKRQMLS